MVFVLENPGVWCISMIRNDTTAPHANAEKDGGQGAEEETMCRV